MADGSIGRCMRGQEFSFALAPRRRAFDARVIEGPFLRASCRFTRLWLALFEERLVGRTLILFQLPPNSWRTIAQGPDL